MPASSVILCPGQGAQAVGMGKAWHEASPEARAVFESADRILGDRLGPSLSELCFLGPADRLNQTDAAQPALFVTAIASLAASCSRWGVAIGELPLAAAAGLSLGEYTALFAAGSISFEDGLNLVTLRGRFMQDAAADVPSGMVAIIGADEKQAAALCHSAAGSDILAAANFNAPGQIVVSGSAAACARALTVASEMGFRATPLPVAGAFHSPIMQPAADRLAEALAGVTIRPPRAPVLSNVTGHPHEGAGGGENGGGGGGGDVAASIRRHLVEQLTAPVRWSECCTWIARNIPAATSDGAARRESEPAGHIPTGVPRARGPDEGGPGSGGMEGWAGCHELAPGKTLAGLFRRINRDVKVESHDQP